MGWYEKTIKTAASPKNIVNNWKVDNPFLKFFIYTYEPLIDLNKIKNKEDLTAYIQNSLIPSLKQKIDLDNPNGYYKKDISDEEVRVELEEHQHDPRMQAVRQIFEKDPKAAKKTILNVINEEKKISFDK